MKAEGVDSASGHDSRHPPHFALLISILNGARPLPDTGLMMTKREGHAGLVGGMPSPASDTVLTPATDGRKDSPIALLRGMVYKVGARRKRVE